MKYRDKTNEEDRKSSSDDLLKKYTDRKPIIVYDEIKDINHKFLNFGGFLITAIIQKINSAGMISIHIAEKIPIKISIINNLRVFYLNFYLSLLKILIL